MLKVKFNIPSLDVNHFKKTLAAHNKQVREEAALNFVIETFLKIPVWSGASRATLIPLATLAKIGELGSSISPVAFEGVDYPTGDPNHGIEAGEKHGVGRYFTRLEETGFEFRTDLFQFYLHESANKWGAMEEGRKAVIDFLRTVKPPNIFSSVKFTRLEV